MFDQAYDRVTMIDDEDTYGPSYAASFVSCWAMETSLDAAGLADEPNLQVPADKEITGRLGDFLVFDVKRGGMSEVYLCIRDGDELRTPLALKSLKPKFQFHPAFRRAFQAECALWACASIAPGILRIFGIIYIDGRHFIVMPGVLPGPRGEASLLDLLRTGPLALDQAVFFASAVAKWLSLAAHAVPGLVHGDLKPANILIRGGVPYISDFGVSRFAGQTFSGDSVMGTRSYCSPLARDPKAPLTAVDDVYSFGVILEQMLTGKIPKPGSPAPRAHPSVTDTPRQIRTDLLALAHQCRAKDPASRPQDFRIVCEEIERLAPEKDGWTPPDSAWLMPDPGPSPTKLKEIAAALIQLEVYDLTIIFIRANTSEKTRGWEIWECLGIALSNTGHPAAALRCYRKALSITTGRESGASKQDRELLQVLCSVAHMTLGDFRRAARTLRRLIASTSNKDTAESAIHSLASVYMEMGRFRQAAWVLEELQTDTKDPYHWNNLGMIYLRLRDWERSAEAYRRAVQLTPWMAESYFGLGQALLGIPARAPEALAAFDRAIEAGLFNRDLFCYALACASILQDRVAMDRLVKIALRWYDEFTVSMMKVSAIKIAVGITTGTLPRPRQARSDKRWVKRRRR